MTPTSWPAVRTSLSAFLITPRSAPSVRLKCVYHWYLVRLVRIACWGLGMSALLVGRTGVGTSSALHGRITEWLRSGTHRCPADVPHATAGADRGRPGG